MCHARPDVAAHCSVVTTALSHAPKAVLPAKEIATTTANIESARRNVMNLVIPASQNASGVASIINARNYAGSCAIVHDAMSRAQSYFLASTPVSVCVGKYVRRSAESVTKTRSRRYISETKISRT